MTEITIIFALFILVGVVSYHFGFAVGHHAGYEKGCNDKLERIMKRAHDFIDENLEK